MYILFALYRIFDIDSTVLFADMIILL